MVSRPRRAFISVLLTALPLLTACAPEPAVHAFRLTEPAAPVELLPVPGDRTDFAWTFDAELAERIDVVVYAVPTVAGESWIGLGASALDRGGMPYVVDHAPTWLTPVVPGQPPPGVYRVQARAWAWVDPEAGETEELAAAFAPGLLVMQGVTFRDRALTFVSADLDRDIWMTTVTASVARAIV